MEGVTRESVRPLLDLQRVDSTTDRLTQRRANLHEQQTLDELNNSRVDVAGRHAERQTALDVLVREQNKIEGDVQQIDAKLEHEQARLYSGDISNPKELSNIQAELDALRRRKAHLEDQDLEVMERREGLESEVAALVAELAQLDAEIADATTRRDAVSTEIEKELASLATERGELVPKLHLEVVELYESVRGKMGGIAVGALVGGVCRACSLPLSPVARDTIKRSDEAIIRCENCRRLLIVL